MTGGAHAVLHDGTTIPVTIRGDGAAILLPVGLAPHTAAEAETHRKWGADPDLGPNLINGLAKANQVIEADYEAHRMASPAPATLTPGNIAADLLTKAGWDVRVLPGLDHMGAMHSAVVLPILTDWLKKSGWVGTAGR